MKKRILPALSIGIGLILLVAALGISLHSQAGSAYQKELLPTNLDGLPLNQAVSGPKAITGVTQLHGVEFPISEAAIGFYGLQGEITLWVSVAPDKSNATEQVAVMTEKINQGNSPFSTPLPQEIDNTLVYALEGLGQQHYYWQNDKFVVWLATDFLIAQEVFDEIFKYYR